MGAQGPPGSFAEATEAREGRASKGSAPLFELILLGVPLWRLGVWGLSTVVGRFHRAAQPLSYLYESGKPRFNLEPDARF